MKKRKQHNSVIDALKTVVDKDMNIFPTLLTIDISGRLIIDGRCSGIDYNSENISLNSQGRRIYIYGDNLEIGNYSKESISISGKIKKIEFFEVK